MQQKAKQDSDVELVDDSGNEDEGQEADEPATPLRRTRYAKSFYALLKLLTAVCFRGRPRKNAPPASEPEPKKAVQQSKYVMLSHISMFIYNGIAEGQRHNRRPSVMLKSSLLMLLRKAKRMKKKENL